MLRKAFKSFFTLKPARDLTTKTATAIWLSIAVIFTQIGDLVSTIVGLEAGATEGNGFVAGIIHDYGYTGLVTLKAVGTAILLWMFWKRPVASAFVIALYAAVVVNNLFAILPLV